jgi:hypothetical protein
MSRAESERVNKGRRKRVRERKVERQKERYVANEQCVGKKKN